MTARRVLVALAIALPLGGCSSGYLQHTDRVAYGAGNAVRTNMAIQTTNPSSGAQFVTQGLGANGHVVPAEGSAPAQP